LPRGDPTLEWILRTGTDPIAAAVHHGVPLEGGEALAAAGAVFGRVDLKTGRVRDLVTVTDDRSPFNVCQAWAAGPDAWVVCKLPEPDRSRAYHLPRTAPLSPRAVEWEKRAGNPTLARGWPSGALFFHDSDSAIVLSGAAATPWKWPTVDAQRGSRGELPVWFISEDNLLPLTDGRLAFVRVLGTEYQLAILDGTGKERVVGRLPEVFRPARMVFEDAGRARILGWAGKTAQIAVVSLVDGAVTMEPVAGLPCPTGRCAWQMSFAERQGLAVRVDVGMLETGPRGPETFHVSVGAAAVTRDGGRTWTALGLPRAAVGGAARFAIPQTAVDGVNAVASPVGMIVGGMARVGWEEGDDGAVGNDEEAVFPGGP
jgi:hypothetical protein